MKIASNIQHPAIATRQTLGSAIRSKKSTPNKRDLNIAPNDLLDGWTVLVYDSVNSEATIFREWVADLGGMVIRMPKVAEAAQYIARHGAEKIALILEVREDDIELRVEECLELRAKFPNCPVILVSDTFARNDYSTERMAICDASLRSPVSQVAFKFGVPVALSNNAYFVARQAILELEV